MSIKTRKRTSDPSSALFTQPSYATSSAEYKGFDSVSDWVSLRLEFGNKPDDFLLKVYKRRKEQMAKVGKYRTFAAEVSDRVRQRNDVIEVDARVYVEGVQIPFSDLSVSQPYGTLPAATISVPPFKGLPEIGRNYYPKVHIFVKDTEAERYFVQEGIKYTDNDIYRVLFTGVIHRSSYSKSHSPGGAQQNISFHCTHKYYVLNEVAIKFNGRGTEAVAEAGSSSATAKVSDFGSQQMIMSAMQPIKKYSSAKESKSVDAYRLKEHKTDGDIDISVLPKYLDKYQKRVEGIPGYLVNIWNATRRDAYIFEEHAKSMVDLYVPLIEQGVRFFQRMSGHGYIEKPLATGIKVAGSVSSENIQSDPAGGSVDSVMIPPIYRNAIGSAAAVDLGNALMGSFLSNTGETSTLGSIFETLVRSIRYDRVTLASPVQSSAPEEEAVDTIIKPLLPLYYSPTCNVLLPTMYNSLMVEDSYYDVPSRSSTVETDPMLRGERLPSVQYRAPHLLRKAVAEAQQNSKVKNLERGDLANTLAYYAETFGSHEEGRGIRPKITQLEGWVKHLNQDIRAREADAKAGGTSGYNSEDNYDSVMFLALAAQWSRRESGDDPKVAEAIRKLNPWEAEDVNGLLSYQRNVMTTVEYDFAITMAQARVGRVSGVFNPYLVPGYPCEIIGKNFSEESYHAFVTSVDTVISSSGHASTSASFTSAYTYEELKAYSLPATQPWLSDRLGLDLHPTLIDAYVNSKPHRAATEYYMSALGVGFANPNALYDFDTGKGKLPILDPSTGSFLEGTPWPDSVAGGLKFSPETVSMLGATTEGALAMVRREIESMGDVEKASRVSADSGVGFNKTPGIKFIHMFGGSEDTTRAVDSALATPDFSTVKRFYRTTTPLGKSAFLIYSDDWENDPYKPE